MITQEYNKQYVVLKSRIRKIKNRLMLSTLNDNTIKIISHLDKIATELDILYSDEMILDSIEYHVEAFEQKEVLV